MPHYRKRFASETIQKSLWHSGAVGIFGQRQVGKTTLWGEFSSVYVAFDRLEARFLNERIMELPYWKLC